jgi:hypothetical protein
MEIGVPVKVEMYAPPLVHQSTDTVIAEYPVGEYTHAEAR